MAKEIPMLFSTPMVQAIMDGRKTQTRRICDKVNYLHLDKHIADWPLSGLMGRRGFVFDFNLQDDVDSYTTISLKPKCEVGDTVWVRETWSFGHIWDGEGEDPRDSGEKPRYIFKTEDIDNIDEDGETLKWRPSIHMPKAAARIFLRVTDVRVERLNVISADDAVMEGCTKSMRNSFGYSSDESEETFNITQSIHTYRILWESINGAGSWAVNPWVWVYSFEVLSTTGRPEIL